MPMSSKNSCVSVMVNGTLVVQEDLGEKITEGKDENTSLAMHEDKPGWANATITWTNEAEKPNVRVVKIHNTADATRKEADDTVQPIVHVIHVVSDKNPSANMEVQPARITLTCHSRGPPPEVKGDDERSSSGASSAPGSDCERSDSDREDVSGEIFSHGFSERSPGRSPAVVNGGGVRVTISTYAEKHSDDTVQRHNNHEGSDSGASSLNEGEPWDMCFHVRELDSVVDINTDADVIQNRIAAAHAKLSGLDLTRGLPNRVRTSIVSLMGQKGCTRNYDLEEKGRIVFYTTTMGIVRQTYERCHRVRKILETLMVRFEERDVFMNRVFQQEIRERLDLSRVIVPEVFVEGRHLGNAEVLEQLNEIGILRELLRPYKKKSVSGVCQQCGGYRYLLCPICGGSKKSANHRHHFSDDLVSLRCVSCDESGLIRCPQCINGEG